MPQNLDHTTKVHFDRQAQDWWDLEGQSKALHDINPTRLSYIEQYTSLENKTVLDIGCGGGILSESLAQKKSIVTGIDASESMIKVAQAHAIQNNQTIDYQVSTAEDFAKRWPQSFDIVTCMELLEHVPNPAKLIHACASLTKPNGDLFFSTINQNLLSLCLAIFAAEYILRIVPTGTHQYKQLIKPKNLIHWISKANLSTIDCRGLQYNPFTRKAKLSNHTLMNYMIFAKKR